MPVCLTVLGGVVISGGGGFFGISSKYGQCMYVVIPEGTNYLVKGARSESEYLCGSERIKKSLHYIFYLQWPTYCT